MINLSGKWNVIYPGSLVGFLALRNVINPGMSDTLELAKGRLVNELRERYASYNRKMLDELPQVQAYQAFYKKYNKTYHVRLQLESIVFKDKSLPSVAPLVEAMFMAELKNLMLTAGHDLDLLNLPIEVGVANGGERLVQFNGQEQELKPGDMLMADQQGILSSVLYGPDRRYSIRTETKRVIYAVYAPNGIGEENLRDHLLDIRRFVHLFSPKAETLYMDILP